MSIEKITSKIVGEAEQSKEEILSEARKKSDAIRAEAKEKADKYIRNEEKRGQEEKEKVISRRKSVADIDCRKIILEKKQELISRCFDKVIDAIITMDEAAYLELLVNLGRNTGLKEGQLIFNEKEKAAIGEKAVRMLSEQVEDGNFSLAEETRAVRGGYMLQSGKVYINNTIEALVEENRDDLSGEIATMLFSQ